jgi:NAD(P)-dependent dehydrogenase (short-subunit alcohol dehydrogenase family)
VQVRTAVITGAAGAIGRAITEGFAAQGMCLGLFDNRNDALMQAASEVADKYGAGKVLACEVDVRDTAQINAGFDAVLEKFGGVDILVNNAAITGIKSVDAITDAELDAIIDVDLKGYIKCARRAVMEMKRAGKGGNILMISSKNGLEGAPDKCLYSAAKGGILTLARALAKELGPFGIRVNSICPDAVLEGSYIWREGGDYRRGTEKRYGLTSDEIPDYYVRRCALKRSILPEDISAGACYLVSEQAGALTGVVLPIDGGVAFVR